MRTRLAQSQHTAEAVGPNIAPQPDFDSAVYIRRKSHASYSAKGASVYMTQLNKGIPLIHLFFGSGYNQPINYA